MTKLTIELVPSTSWYNNVRAKVTTREWDIIRKAVYNSAHNVCEICGGKGKKHAVECHEIWEYDDSKYIQKLIGMIALCPSCHKVKHMGLAKMIGEYEIAVKHLAKVNGWTKEDAKIYIEAQFEKWAQRSNHKWTLDIVVLDTYLKKG
jgi:hypothetical protein